VTLRFTQSKDGTPRANVRVTLRLTAEEVAEIKRRAGDEGCPWREWLQQECENGFYRALLNKDVGDVV
jgi:predicted DNA binding CopG/RHH family protein